jgi:hypothetical protein
MRASAAAAVPFVLAVLIACQHAETTTFPPGLAPLEPDPAPPPAATSTNEYPESLDLQQGSDATSNYVHATGYVDAPIETVWTAMKNPAVVVDRHNISSYTVDWNVETGYDVSFRTDYVIDDIETVDFDLTWREGVYGGSEASPTVVSVVYQKTYGSSFVSYMAGSIELTAVNANVTELQFAQRMNATETDSNNIAAWTSEMFASIVATAHGQPLP